ncbi:hypothetical protein ACGFYV_19760 [Streptomyces sp. NPDC048297]|uniref:hypothetical protein n=1 Tax=Streptomyces sp. NPDC048297 TaxID=3365531 RepID=UPI00371C036A
MPVAKEIIRCEGGAVLVTLMSLILLLGAASATYQARKGRWYAVGGILLPILGLGVMLFGGVQRHSLPLLWLGTVLALGGFALEFIAYRRRTRP